MTSAPAAPPRARVADEAAEPVLRVRRRPRPGNWILSAVALVFVAMFVHGLVRNPGWDWPTFARYFTAKSVLAALWLTLRLTFYGTVLGFLLGVALAAARLGRAQQGEGLVAGTSVEADRLVVELELHRRRREPVAAIGEAMAAQQEGQEPGEAHGAARLRRCCRPCGRDCR